MEVSPSALAMVFLVSIAEAIVDKLTLPEMISFPSEFLIDRPNLLSLKLKASVLSCKPVPTASTAALS